MRYPREELDAYRKGAGEFENELIDEYREGTVTRRELLQRGSVLGMSIPLLSLIAGVPLATAAPQRQARSTAGVLRVGSPTADGSLEPPLLQSLGALAVSHMAGEQLVFADKNSRLVPRLATSWKASNKAKTWTFQIRRNVRFHDGTPLTARRRGRVVQAAPDEGLAGALVLQGRDRRRQEGRRERRPVQPRRAERVLPVRAQPADVPGDHPAEVLPAAVRPLQAGRVDVHDERHRPVQAEGEPRRGRVHLRREPDLLGRATLDRHGRVADPRGSGPHDRASRVVRSTSPSSSRTREPSRSATRRSRCGRQTTATCT